MSINKKLCFAILVSIFVNVYAFDDDVKTDILMEKITSSIKDNRFGDALPAFKELEAIRKPLPESFYYYYIQALDKTGGTLDAFSRAEKYLTKYGKKGKYYGQVVEVFARLEGPALKIRSQEAAQALRNAGEAAKKELKDNPDQVSDGTLIDSTTGIQWTQSDNGSDISWTEASAYCKAIGIGWDLPGVAQLQSLVDSTHSQRCGTSTCRVSPKFRLSESWFWSNERESSSQAWGVGFGGGTRGADRVVYRTDRRALCVRRP